MRRCLDEVMDEVADEFWPPCKSSKRKLPKSVQSNMEKKDVYLKEVVPGVKEVTPAVEEVAPVIKEFPNKGKHTGRLRSHPRTADA